MHERIYAALANKDTDACRVDKTLSNSTGSSRPWLLQDGHHLEKAAVHFTSAGGPSLPSAAAELHPNLAGKRFSAVSVSVIVHPRNPHVPAAHMNIRYFDVQTRPHHWHFGGGFDLTPHLPCLEDAVAWHRSARAICRSDSEYVNMKRSCDAYFRLTHRSEQRGVGGIFFDEFTRAPFGETLQFVRSVGEAFLDAYLVIFNRRCRIAWSIEDEQWMLHRRGRYVEFNLSIDRGTRYGLQSGRRVESVLASLPPRATWRIGHAPRPGSPYEQLVREFLVPRDWLGLENQHCVRTS